MSRRIHLISAPTNLGLTKIGVELAPEALLDRGLASRLSAEVTELPAPTRTESKYRGILHAREIGLYSNRIAEAVREARRENAIPILLGGDCTVLFGLGAALSPRFHKLLYLDGHQDCYSPSTSPTQEAADMTLAIATATVTCPSIKPTVQFRATDVYLFGYRDASEALKDGCRPLEDAAASVSFGNYRRRPKHTLDLLSRMLTAPFCIHFDADVLDNVLMPAVDYRQPDGMKPEEVLGIIGPLCHAPEFRGMSVSIYNPTLDDDGSAGDMLCELLVAALK